MANPYYDHTTYPATGATGSSSALRAELDSIEAGFDAVEAAIADAPVSADILAALNLKVDIATPSITGALDCNNNAIAEMKTASFNGEVAASGTSGAVTCAFANGQKMKVVPTGNITSFVLSFPGVGHYQLRIAMGLAYTVAWTFSGVNAYNIDVTAPTTGANKSTFVNFFFDGTDCFYSRSQQA